VEWGVLASRKDPFDPMEKAFLALLDGRSVDDGHKHPGWDIVREYPLSKEFLSVTHVWRPHDGGDLAVALKGAPETVMDLCHLDASRCAEIARVVASMAEDGLRVLGVASGTLPARARPDAMPASQHDFDFTFRGLVALADPIRPAVPDAVRQCVEAGIRVVMITGDYPRTASNIGRQIGLEHPANVITGQELQAMSAEDLATRIKECHVFARVVPEQKLLLIQAMKLNGEVVAMTGDGVNDAPALKAAHIGVAMGQRGTDVAREASALVLMDDDFSSIVAAVRTGRRIFDNLKKAMAYIVSVHVPIAGMSLLPVLLAWKDPALLPVHIVFLELIIDPACSIVFEGQPEEKNIMNRPPRRPDASLFGKKTLLLSLAQGLTALGCVLATWFLAGAAGLGAEVQRTLSFITLIVANLAVILSTRSWNTGFFAAFRERNPAVPWVVGGASAFLALVVAVPFLRDLFHFGLPGLPWILAAVGLGILTVGWFEVL
jgi:Ca2+-transporting ATPase